MTDDWTPPRCSHGHIILGCPDDTCPEQTKYLGEQDALLVAHYERQRQEARRVVREAMGMPA